MSEPTKIKICATIMIVLLLSAETIVNVLTGVVL